MDARNALEQLTRLKSDITDHANWSEDAGYLHSNALQALVQIGVPRFFLPKALGGYEMSPVDCAVVTEAIANIDASAAWHVMVYNAARLAGAAWNQDLVDLVWGDDPDALVSASGNNPYEAVESGDFYQINGVNHFASGCRHAKWMLSPVRLNGEINSVLLPMDDCEILENWDSLGMRGSGSNSVRAVNVAVPKHHVNPMPSSNGERNPYYSGLLYRAPARIVFSTYVPIALSLAKRSLDVLLELALNKVPYALNAKLKTRVLAQTKYAEALAIYRSAKAFFYEEVERAWEVTKTGLDFDHSDKANLYLAGVHAVQSSARVVKLVADASGTSVTDKNNPLDQISRDMETLRHHGFVNESRYASVTQVLWDSELDYPLILR